MMFSLDTIFFFLLLEGFPFGHKGDIGVRPSYKVLAVGVLTGVKVLYVHHSLVSTKTMDLGAPSCSGLLAQQVTFSTTPNGVLVKLLITSLLSVYFANPSC
jgi:hypothetical protein